MRYSLSSFIDSLFEQYPHLENIINDCTTAHAHVYLVGGSVRDFFLSLPIKDLDIEVHNISLEELSTLLSKYGTVDYVGKSFGVLRVRDLNIDWSIPRRDSAGRKPVVQLDPSLSIDDAFRRRDLTINAMGIDVQKKKLIDPFNGLRDLEDRILRAVDPHFFVEDPLRFFRVMQFIGRFGMQPDRTLNELCTRMDISSVSSERIEAEFEKLLLKSSKPSLGFRWLVTIGRLQDVLPELYETIGVEQNPFYHPEGDVFEHSMQAVDHAAQIQCDNQEDRLILLYAALCHDLGKVETTKYHEDGKLHSYGHEIASVSLAKKMLERITHKKNLIATVVKLVRYHMVPLNLVKNKAKLLAYKRLALKLAPQTNIKMLINLVLADKSARTVNNRSASQDYLRDLAIFKKKAQDLGVYEHPEPPLLQGKDLIKEVGAGPHLGALLERAYALQLAQSFTDKEELKKRVLSSIKRK